MKIRKAVILAGGLGTRFFPATKSLDKEMLPIVDKPCIQYLVEEAVQSGIKDIIIVTSKGKNSIENHFKNNPALTKHLKAAKKTDLINELKKIESLAKITFVKQNKPLGDGHAILCARKHLKDQPFAVLFGDDIYDSNPPALAQLIKEYEKHQTPVIALERIDKKDSGKYGIIKPASSKDRTYKIADLIEKPSPDKAPSNLAITGKYIVTPSLLDALSKSKSGAPDKELRLIDGMRNYVKTNPIHGYEIKGQRFDTGDKLGYLKAIIHFSLKDKRFNKELRLFLRNRK